jgi:trehalose 6-phosphate synthase
MGRLVVVSNRVAAAEDSARAGGLSVALRAALKAGPAMWFGWSGERVADYTGELKTHRIDDIDVVTLDLEDADFEEYYNGYANATLWPLFHSRTDLADYTRSYGQGYARVNRRFAEALAPLLRPEDLVWVHDYHLIPLGRELRRLGAVNSIGFFLHIPWPAPQLFTTLPQHADLADAMFAYDLVGFQTGACVDAFADYVTREARGRREGDLLTAFGRSTLAGAFPIGIDTPQFLRLVRSPAAERAWDRMAAHGVFRSLIVGVDRLDYSKGLPERLIGFEQFLKENPDLVRKVLYLQIAPSSREGVEAYQTLRAQVLALAGRADAVREPQLRPRRARRHLPRRAGGAGHAAARRHEPGRQGVRRRPGSRRSGRAGAVALRRRGRADDRRADRQPLLRRGTGRGDRRGAADAAPRARTTLVAADGRRRALRRAGLARRFRRGADRGAQPPRAGERTAGARGSRRGRVHAFARSPRPGARRR